MPTRQYVELAVAIDVGEEDTKEAQRRTEPSKVQAVPGGRCRCHSQATRRFAHQIRAGVAVQSPAPHHCTNAAPTVAGDAENGRDRRPRT